MGQGTGRCGAWTGRGRSLGFTATAGVVGGTRVPLGISCQAGEEEPAQRLRSWAVRGGIRPWAAVALEGPGLEQQA